MASTAETGRVGLPRSTIPVPEHETAGGLHAPSLDITDCINETCPWSGKPVQADSLTEYDGKVVGFRNPGCRDKFQTAIRHFDEARGSKACKAS